ncbi:hypothetical protein B0H34DRAFT_667077 [Crassisporium funariophilum]|nr:hypothetical protein B0H34DRAFT_667077 [Crassisporium funariophilum]
MLRRLIRIVPKSNLRLESRLTSNKCRYHTSTGNLPSITRLNTIRFPSQQCPVRHTTTLKAISLLRPTYSASFHSTARNQGGPLIPVFAALLKASTGFTLVRTASRVALTFIPLLWITTLKSHKVLKYSAIYGIPTTEAQKERHIKKIRNGNILLRVLLLVPLVLFCSTIVASLEQTPLTGRWRAILLSPEEEDEIASQLAGPGWYNSVSEILAEEGSPRLISSTDWRYQWVYETLQKLESTIPILAREPELCPNWKEGSSDSRPLPPPAEYPLRPRPRASEYIHWMCQKLNNRGDTQTAPHVTIPGPPYSLLVVDNPEASNAFSYGFGPDGGSGIVVYSGFLDDIFAKMPAQYDAPPPIEKSIWSKFFGGIFSSPPSQPLHPTPTPDQTTELAILLAHEMAHLILSHHLESLSSFTVIVPGTLSILSDVIRVLIFPITMFFGPFVNDAVAQIGKVGSGELTKLSEYCTSAKQEIEADVVSARLLAHAGFDARDAVEFWETRSGAQGDCAMHGQPLTSHGQVKIARRIMGDSHPVSELRVICLKEELSRWESERRKATGLPSS